MRRPHDGYAAARARRAAERKRRIDQMAEPLSRGFSPAEAGASIGVSRNTADSYWRAIRVGLGWQAI